MKKDFDLYMECKKIYDKKILKGNWLGCENNKKNNFGFTLIEVVVSMALLTVFMIVIMQIIDFVIDTSLDNEISSEFISTSSSTKELLLKTLDVASSIEILRPITSNNLEDYTTDFENDDEYCYLYSLNGKIYFRGSYKGNIGDSIKILESINVDLGFSINKDNTRIVDVDMKFYEDDNMLEENIIVAPINLSKEGEIIDSRVNKNENSNIIRYLPN